MLSILSALLQLGAALLLTALGLYLAYSHLLWLIAFVLLFKAFHWIASSDLGNADFRRASFVLVRVIDWVARLLAAVECHLGRAVSGLGRWQKDLWSAIREPQSSVEAAKTRPAFKPKKRYVAVGASEALLQVCVAGQWLFGKAAKGFAHLASEPRRKQYVGVMAKAAGAMQTPTFRERARGTVREVYALLFTVAGAVVLFLGLWELATINPMIDPVAPSNEPPVSTRAKVLGVLSLDTLDHKIKGTSSAYRAMSDYLTDGSTPGGILPDVLFAPLVVAWDLEDSATQDLECRPHVLEGSQEILVVAQEELTALLRSGGDEDGSADSWDVQVRIRGGEITTSTTIYWNESLEIENILRNTEGVGIRSILAYLWSGRESYAALSVEPMVSSGMLYLMPRRLQLGQLRLPLAQLGRWVEARWPGTYQFGLLGCRIADVRAVDGHIAVHITPE